MPSGSGFPGFQAIGVDCFWNFPVAGSKVETMAAARTLPTRKGLAAAPVNAGLRKFLFFVEPRGSSKHVSAHLGASAVRCWIVGPQRRPDARLVGLSRSRNGRCRYRHRAPVLMRGAVASCRTPVWMSGFYSGFRISVRLFGWSREGAWGQIGKESV